MIMMSLLLMFLLLILLIIALPDCESEVSVSLNPQNALLQLIVLISLKCF